MPSTNRKLLTGLGLLAGGAWLVNSFVRQARSFSYAGKTVLITGGSRGLGLVIARQLVDQGARVAICARTDADLESAAEELRDRGGDVMSINCDVGDQSQVNRMIKDIELEFGRIDIVINAAGVIQVGPLDAMTVEDFHEIMKINCWGALYTSLAVIPSMRRRGWGRIVNVASIGGKVAVPHLLPYVASKFALVGLSNGLRAELLKDGIYVTTACPSLMRTGSPRNAIFKGQHKKEYAWFNIGDSLPGVSMSAEQAASQILRACQHGRRELVVHQPWNLAMAGSSLFPGLTQELANWVDVLLPEMGGIGKRAARGYESESVWSPSWLTILGERAARQNNEMGTHPPERMN